MISLLLCLASSIHMDTSTRMFTDQQGRSLIYHGFNIVVKLAPYIPITSHFDPQMSLTTQDIQNLKDWGFNFIRMGVMWEAVQRAPQQYNITYLQEMDNLITKLGQSGIYTLVDAHQDVFARHICGEGVPNFYAQYLQDTCTLGGALVQDLGGCTPMSKYNFQMDSQGNPVIEDCLKHLFAQYYATPEAMSAFERLYKNTHGLQDRFADFWNVTSFFFKNNPYVLGYDIINEPQTANAYSEPWLYLPGMFDRAVLQPLYQRMNSVIRANDKKKIVFFQPTQGDLLPVLGGIIFNTGFTQTPGGPEQNQVQILNDHTYCCQAAPTMCATGEPPLDQAETCRRFNYNRVSTRAQNAKDLGVGLIISEFGACSGSESCVKEVTGVADACDQNLVSWAYWMFKGFGDFTTSGSYTEGLWDQQGNLEKGKLKALSRTYIQAFQGVPVQVSFDAESGEFEAAFELKEAVKAPTVLFLNKELYYSQGYELTVSNSEGLEPEIVENGNYIEIFYKDPVDSVTNVAISAKKN